MSRSPCRTRAVIDVTLVERLDSLAGAAVARLPEIAYPLVNKLNAAKLVSPARLPTDVVTIGSLVEYRDDLTGRPMRVRLVWPEHADISQGRVSVLTPVGVALLGLPAGGWFRWITRGGEKRALTVLEVIPKDCSVAEA